MSFKHELWPGSDELTLLSCLWTTTHLYSSVEAVHTIKADLSFVLLVYPGSIWHWGPETSSWPQLTTVVTLTTLCTTNLLQRHVVLVVVDIQDKTSDSCPVSELKCSLTGDINGSQTEVHAPQGPQECRGNKTTVFSPSPLSAKGFWGCDIKDQQVYMMYWSNPNLTSFLQARSCHSLSHIGILAQR